MPTAAATVVAYVSRFEASLGAPWVIAACRPCRAALRPYRFTPAREHADPPRGPGCDICRGRFSLEEVRACLCETDVTACRAHPWAT